MKSGKRSTYLSRVESNYFSRKWYRREVTLFCNLLFTAQWMRKAQLHRCLITEISEGGASLRIGKAVVPDHVYLVLGQFDFLIGSVVVGRDSGNVHLCFVKEQTPGFINRMSRLSSPFATLESLTGKTIFPNKQHAQLKPEMPPFSRGRTPR